MVEPELHNLQVGIQNFKRNGLTGEFIQAFVGKGQFEIDSYLKKQEIPKIDILHSDIQGYEIEMLESGADSLASRKINYLFISTHTQELHQRTIGLLEKYGYRIEISSDCDHGTTSFDGLVFACSPSVNPIFKDFAPLKRVQIAEARPELLINYLSKTIRNTSAHGAPELVLKDAAVRPNIISETPASVSTEKTDPKLSISPQIMTDAPGPSASLFDVLPRPESMISIVDIGAMMLGDYQGPYATLVDKGYAHVIGFEPGEAECEKLNSRFTGTHRFYPFFIGDGGPATFYETNMNMTGSLFRPNKLLLEQFVNLHELTTLVGEHSITTRRLDDLDGLGDVDMVKIDVQGAELAVFKGAERVLSKALFVHAEVEFVELYEGQPLFAEIDQFLRASGFQFHTFEGFGQRSFKPLVVAQNQNRGLRQLLWSDAIYVRDFLKFDILTDQKLLKLAIIAHEVYRSCDLAYRALECFDKKRGTQLCNAYKELLGSNLYSRQ
jgi:FkbM family methyltransferase